MRERATTSSPVVAPTLPPGRFVELEGRGRTFYREAAGPPGAPVVLLLHGWTASADLNFHALFEPLAQSYRVIAIDHRGHGRGLRVEETFTLEDAADDAAALCRQLDIAPVIAVGYSMGGTIAQLLWKQHPDVLDGLVLCATAATFADSWRDSAMFGLLGGITVAGRKLPVTVQRRIGLRLLSSRRRDLARWVTSELERHDWGQVSEAGMAIGRFNSEDWLSAVDVPTSVVVTLHDDVVDPIRQLRMGRAIPGAELMMIEGDHAVCASEPEKFGAVLSDAIAVVGRRAQRAARSGRAPTARTPKPAADGADVDEHGFTFWRLEPAASDEVEVPTG